jgi:hypothetical protein
MAENTSKWIDAITRLTKLTQEGALEWSSAASNSVLVSDETQQVESVFVANYKDKRLRLYKKRFKVEEPYGFFLSGIGAGPFARKYPYWTAQIYLEVIDGYGNSLWTFPEVSALRDLLAAVKYQVSGVKDLLDDLLKDEGA